MPAFALLRARSFVVDGFNDTAPTGTYFYDLQIRRSSTAHGKLVSRWPGAPPRAPAAPWNGCVPARPRLVSLAATSGRWPRPWRRACHGRRRTPLS